MLKTALQFNILINGVEVPAIPCREETTCAGCQGPWATPEPSSPGQISAGPGRKGSALTRSLLLLISCPATLQPGWQRHRGWHFRGPAPAQAAGEALPFCRGSFGRSEPGEELSRAAAAGSAPAPAAPPCSPGPRDKPHRLC